MLRGLWLKFDRDWGWNLARILAFASLQMLFAVLGLQLVVLALVLRLTDEALEQKLVAQLTRLLPDRVTSAAVSAFEQSLQHAPWWLLLVALPIVLWEGSRFFVVLESTLCVIFRRRQRTFLRQNRAALAMLLLFAALVPVIVLSAAFAPHVGLMTARAHATASTAATTAASLVGLGGAPFLPYFAVAAGLAANLTLLLIAYTIITPGRVSFRAAWLGALLAAVLVEFYVLCFPIYVRNVLHPDHFGTVAGFVLVILVFFFAYALFIVVGAEVAAWREGYRAAARDIPTTLALAAPPRLRSARSAETLPDSYTPFAESADLPALVPAAPAALPADLDAPTLPSSYSAAPVAPASPLTQPAHDVA